MVISIKRNEWTYQMTDSHRSQNAALIQTNKDRRAQLDQIADIFGTKTPNETLGAIIRSFADQGLISGDIPGLKVNVASDGIVIRMDAGQPVGLSVDAAQSLIATLRAYIDGTQSGVLHNLDANYSIVRRGKALRLAVPMDSGGRAFGFDVSLDIIAHLERAIVQVQAQA